MGRVTCFAVAGVYAWFNSNDHLPPHVHIEDTAGTWEIKVLFLREGASSIEVVRGSGPSPRLRQDILRAVENHRPELLAEWEAKVLVKSPGSPR